jgi:Folate-sensitive fragile site protein Fra10Ac1
MAAKYYEKLFKEYALADVSRYREGKIGMRWRTEAEVVAGRCVAAAAQCCLLLVMMMLW